MSLPLEATNTSSAKDNRHSDIIAVTVVFSSLSLLTVCLRLLSRRLKRVDLHYDDYLVIAAWVILDLCRNRWHLTEFQIFTFAEGAMVAAGEDSI